MNNFNGIGRLTAKPELRYTQANIPVVRFTIAIDRYKKDCDKQTDFIPVQCWRKLAENVSKYLDKGSLVAVVGSLQSGKYTNKDGHTIYTLDVVANNVQFLENKKTEQVSGQVSEQVSQSESDDVFADFGEQVSIDDNFLE